MRRFCAVIAAVAAIVAASPSVAECAWTILPNGSLTIVGDQSPSTLRDVAIQIAEFRAVMSDLIKNADRPLSVPTVVIVVGDRKSMESLVPLYNGKPATVAGYFGQGPDLNYIVMSVDRLDESTKTIYHEYTHLLLRNAVRSLPLWVSEGLAEFYSTYAVAERGKAVEVGRRITEHIEFLAGHYVALQELLTVDRSSPMYNEGERQSLFYAESWAFTHYLMMARPGGAAALMQYAADITDGRAPLDAFNHAFGSSPADLDKELVQYLRRPTLPAVRIRFQDKLKVAEPPPGHPITAAEVDAWMGDAQRRAERTEGVPRIERAAAADPANSTTQMALGLLRLSQERTSDALTAFGRAASLAPNDFLTQFVCGISRLRADPRASNDLRLQALATLKRAVMLNGSSADAHAALAYAQMLSEDTLADARSSIERAIGLAPGRLDFRLRFADIRLLQGDVDAARNILSAIAAIKADPAASAAATERLSIIAENEIRLPPSEATRDSPPAATRDDPSPADTVRPDDSKERRSGLLLRAVHSGEERMLGQLTRIDCARGTVRFTVESEDREVTAAATRMEDVELTTFLDDKSFSVVCGARPAPERVYLTWQPDTKWGSGIVGTAVAVEFLPKSFVP
ncbi:MAG TPA: tetratricopeptide repeat protein [Vicinamibacterales bacterium]|jgi:tetratricopeptide (TPR) repeat protein